MDLYDYDQKKGKGVGVWSGETNHSTPRLSALNLILIGIIVLMVLGACGYLYYQHGHDFGFEFSTKNNKFVKNNHYGFGAAASGSASTSADAKFLISFLLLPLLLVSILV